MINDLLKRYEKLKCIEKELVEAKNKWIECYENGGKILACGNGGSCADCDHIVGELMKGFLNKRSLTEAEKQQMLTNCPEISEKWLCMLQKGLPAVSLCSMNAANTAFLNDVDAELVYAQQLMGLGKKGDVLLCFSTSGNSKNVYAAAVVAKSLGITVIGFTGKTGGKLKNIVDLCICADEEETYKIQELHLPIYHYLCAEVEKHFFG